MVLISSLSFSTSTFFAVLLGFIVDFIRYVREVHRQFVNAIIYRTQLIGVGGGLLFEGDFL